MQISESVLGIRLEVSVMEHLQRHRHGRHFGRDAEPWVNSNEGLLMHMLIAALWELSFGNFPKTRSLFIASDAATFC